jgi:hypothetical protein
MTETDPPSPRRKARRQPMTAGEFVQSVEKLKAETTAPAKEVLEHIHKAILAIPEFTLKDGTKACVTDLAPPGLNDDGELVSGFDVQLPNHAHLEFYVKNTGWGRPFTAAVAPKKPRPGRHR